MPEGERVERLLGRHDVQRVCRWITRKRRDGGCLLADFFTHSAGGKVPLRRRALFAVPSLLTNYIRKKTGAKREVLREKVFGHQPTARALVNTVRSIGRFGLSKPQQWAAPMLAVWNFTQACNLKCVHCYQDARGVLPDELDLPQQKAIVDDLRANDTSWLALSGGEPLMGRNFWAVAEYAGQRGFHLSVASNGTLITKETAKRLADIGVRYVEISLDSLDAETHDRFRGGKGLWQRTVEGIDTAVAQQGLRVCIATTITRLNLKELPQIIDFAVAHKVNAFYAFNFIPTGRAVNATEIDLTPEMREEMLGVLQAELGRNRLAIMTSSPQMGRVCMERLAIDGKLNTGHYGVGNAKLVGTLVPYIGGCGAGRLYIAIQPNGLVTPCVFMRGAVVGDFRTQRLQDFWLTNPLLQTLRNRDERSGHCRECKYKIPCGGCRARALGYFGDATRADPGCILNLAEWQELQGRAVVGEVHAGGERNEK